MTIAQDSSHPTGVADDSVRGNSDVTRARLRKARAALSLKEKGYKWDQIAEHLGFPTGREALVATEQALEGELKTTESQAFMRNMASDRYERLLRGVWAKAIDPQNPDHLQAVDRARQIMKDHADLHGYAAPKQAVVASPTQAQIEQWVAGVVNLGTTELEEADIFEADVISDEKALDAAPTGGGGGRHPSPSQ